MYTYIHTPKRIKVGRLSTRKARTLSTYISISAASCQSLHGVKLNQKAKTQSPKPQTVNA